MMRSWRGGSRWPTKKRPTSTSGGGGGYNPIAPYSTFAETNLIKPGMLVNEFSGLPFGSGSSGQQSPSGTFQRWRGRREDMYGTHSDNNQDALELWWARFDGYEFAKDLNLHFDVSIGLFGKDYNGTLPQETWKGAGRGDYDARWIATLQNARTRLHSRVMANGQPPKVFIRPAHEANGNWYPWSFSNYWLREPVINGVAREVSNMDDVVLGFQRFYDLAAIHYPEAFVVINFNRTGEGFSAFPAGGTGGSGFSGNWADVARRLGPAMDAYGVDYYNWYNTIFTRQDWLNSLNETHTYGSPKGINTHKALAIELGKPMSFSEWGGVSTAPGMPRPTPAPDQVLGPGDSPEFILGMYEFFYANAPQNNVVQPGNVLYELYWNVLMPGGDQSGADHDKFHLLHVPGSIPNPWWAPNGVPVTKMAQSARVYQIKHGNAPNPTYVPATTLLANAPNSSVPPASGPGPTGPPGAWTLAFSDDFDGTAVDTTKWVVANGQYKQNRMTPIPANVTVANSEVRLALSVAQLTGDYAADEIANRGAQMHSGIHNGLNRADGAGYRAPVGSYVEARMWLPGQGQHLHNWSAVWTCGEGWPRAGEHDIIEALQFSSAEGANAYAVYHFHNSVTNLKDSKRVYNQTTYMGDAWHTVGVHRKATTADYYWDGVKINTITTDDNGLAHAIVLTTGALGVGGDRPPVLGLPGAMRVDWVKSWHPA